MARPKPPFREEDQLAVLGQYHLPGHPRVDTSNPRELTEFLLREFDLQDLAKMAPRLWMMSQQKSTNISALHRQRVKGREVIVTEDPRMHLLWHYERIYIKPLPKYLLSYVFWETYLSDDKSLLGEHRSMIQGVALGYLRSYFYLIQHESDFLMATRYDLRLVPADVTWEQYCALSSRFKDIPDEAVAERYHFGEIRLSRLNFYTNFFLFKRHFQRVHGQYAAYFGAYYAPLLYVFGTFSVVLNAFQVELTAESLFGSDGDPSPYWQGLWQASRYFSATSLVFILFISAWLASLFASKFWTEWSTALGDRRRKKKLAQLKGRA